MYAKLSNHYRIGIQCNREHKGRYCIGWVGLGSSHGSKSRPFWGVLRMGQKADRFGGFFAWVKIDRKVFPQNKTKQNTARMLTESLPECWLNLPCFVLFCFVGSRDRPFPGLLDIIPERSDFTPGGVRGGRWLHNKDCIETLFGVHAQVSYDLECFRLKVASDILKIY